MPRDQYMPFVGPAVAVFLFSESCGVWDLPNFSKGETHYDGDSFLIGRTDSRGTYLLVGLDAFFIFS